ncbi:LAME_0D09538g1_1 [Lachancea meyersii CBS 8951]|uniref:E3 ubiquitin-protein ligase listerin n=1 Tax=Lachancea meyersii CBS 8951 TaxID=1266667 RepID=A0A1G4JBG6_9SACH|nr:LAME_0D09538g1_1 [Lachancea meyersii CBS 8951]
MSFGLANDWGLGNNGVKISINYFDGIIEQSLLGALGSAELQLIFKSLLKRDETTKEKALCDLLALLGDEKNRYLFEDECFALCWSQIYAKLTTNESRNVRVSAHTITTDVIRLVGKKSGKFLKDFVPFLLSGIYDHDAFVSKSCSKSLLHCFGDNSQKVNALWKLFQAQALRLVKEVLIVETPESLADERYVSKQDLQLKYARVAMTAICMLDRLARENPENFTPETSEYLDILSSDSLWNLLSFKDIHSLKTCEALMRLIGTMWDLGFLTSCKPVIKLVSKRFLKSIGQLSGKNVPIASPLFPKIMCLLSDLLQYKDGKMLSWDKASHEKIKKLLLLGPANSDPSYYNALLSLYEKNNAVLGFDYHSEWLEIWHKNHKYESQRRGVPVKCQAMSDKFWEAYLRFISLAPAQLHEEIVEASHNEIFTSLKEKSLTKNPSIVDLFVTELSFDALEIEITSLLPSGVNSEQKDKQYLNNLFTIAFSKKQNELFLRHISEVMIASMKQHEFRSSHYGYIFFTQTMDSSHLQLRDQLIELLELLSRNLSSESYHAASNIFTSFSHTFPVDQLEDTRVSDAFISFLNKLVELDIPEASKLAISNNLDKSYLQNIAKRSHCYQQFQSVTLDNFVFSDSELYKSQLINEKTIYDLYEKAAEHSQLRSFCSNISCYQPSLYEHLLLHSHLIVDVLFGDYGAVASDMRAKVLQLSKINDDVAIKAGHAAVQSVKLSSENMVPDMQEYMMSLVAANDKVIEVLLPQNILQELDGAVPFVSHQMATSSSLGLNVFLLPTSDQEIDLALVEPVIKMAQFLDSILAQMPEYLTDEVLLYLTSVSELAADYNFYSSTPSEEYQSFKCTLFASDRVNFDASAIIQALVDTKIPDFKILEMLTNTENVTATITFFNCRIIKKLLTNAVDYCSASILDDKSIESFILRTVREKTLSSGKLLQSATILSSITKFSTSDALTKTRTYLASELIGAKVSEAVERTTSVLILLNNLLKLDDFTNIPENYQPIAPQRLKMILKDVDRWCDSEFWYDDSFSVLRLALSEFLESLLILPSSSALASSLCSHAHRIVRDCVDLVSAGGVPYACEFKIRSISLYRRLSSEKTNAMLGLGDLTPGDESELFDALMEAFLLQADYNKHNHFSFVFYRSLGDILHRSATSNFSRYGDGLMKNITLSSSEVNIDQERLAVRVLRESILLEQQTLLIDFEFHNSSQDTVDDESVKKFQLPTELLDKVEHDAPHEYLENENEYLFLKYLWGCYLTLTYFKNISYNLRQLYVGQLKERGLIFKLFDFISDQLDLDDKSWVPLEESFILAYDIEGLGLSSSQETILQECKNLLLHLLYVLFKDMGAITSSWWLNLKDRALQAKIEKFSAAYISPILVKQELEDVGKKAKKLTDQDETLTVKVNNVTNEIKAGYLVDEQKLEIALRLPSNYPLNNIEVHGVSRVGISEQKWKSWILSAQRVMVGMNGSVMDSLELFTKNVNLHFAGFEECAICYSILHAVDRKLPTKVCPTCKNRFHGACLYKWFRSSGNNTCPLCRSEIPFRR